MTTQRQLLKNLWEKDVLPRDWQDAVGSVDRALFIPEVIVNGNFAKDPEEWLRTVYADVPVVTQVNDGKSTADDAFRLNTSSSSMPSIMLEMLALLDVRDGQRVLEIGTGTGYHAAWLCHRLGDADVTSVELDEAVLTVANENLRRAGFHPTTVLGDGRDGHQSGAPYDRIICTCTVRNVPSAWLAQCPSGRIVTPWGSSFYSGSFVTLDVVEGEARGGFSGSPAFMWERSQRGGAGRISDLYHGETGRKSTTDIAPQHVIQDDSAFFIGLSVTDVWFRWCDADDESEEATLWFFADDGMSWATVEFVPNAETHEVEQFGPRELWDEVRTAFLYWYELGMPGRSRFGLSVDGGGQRVWWDDPHRVISGH